MILSDKKIIEKLMFICEFFYEFKSNISKEVIDKTTKLINFIEYSNKNMLEISDNVIVEIINYINIIEQHVKHKKKLEALEVRGV